ncbi:MAG: FIST C-terminal domain-containing protein [Candidatus Omnitrophica bacterium]|nr:FIST C-terminal domain-containing protein [Candidatus Omnitrophota bacterium]
MEEKFIVALSQKDDENAIKEVALKIKYSFLKPVKIFFLLFTPHYNPQALLKTISLTLNPTFILGIQSPSLIFEGQIIEKGIIGCCFAKEGVTLSKIFINKETEATIEDIELSLRLAAKNLKDKQFFFSLIPQHFNIFNCVQGFTLALGKVFNVLGVGFFRKYGNKNYLIVNDTVDEGLLGIIGGGLKIEIFRIGGFVPIGKPFMINHVSEKQGIIRQINNLSPIEIYKHYLDEKIDIFTKNKLFTLYPLITDEDYLINVIDCLEDGSFLCIGEVKEKKYAHLSIFHPEAMFSSIKDKLNSIKSNEDGILFIINSLMRKKIIKEYAYKEIETIRQLLDKNLKIIGIYSDFFIFSNYITRKIISETATNLLVFFQ